MISSVRPIDSRKCLIERSGGGWETGKGRIKAGKRRTGRDLNDASGREDAAGAIWEWRGGNMANSSVVGKNQTKRREAVGDSRVVDGLEGCSKGFQGA